MPELVALPPPTANPPAAVPADTAANTAAIQAAIDSEWVADISVFDELNGHARDVHGNINVENIINNVSSVGSVIKSSTEHEHQAGQAVAAAAAEVGESKADPEGAPAARAVQAAAAAAAPPAPPPPVDRAPPPSVERFTAGWENSLSIHAKEDRSAHGLDICSAGPSDHVPWHSSIPCGMTLWHMTRELCANLDVEAVWRFFLLAFFF